MKKERVLFVCVHNSARSKMAEAYLKSLGGGAFDVRSAGLEPEPFNPLAVEAMREVGLDFSDTEPQSVFDLFKQGELYSYVITVCDNAETKCPIFPGLTQRLHWPFDDPAGFKGSWEEKLELTRRVRDQIKTKVSGWLTELKEAS
jgi:arsenate reductase